MANRAIKILAIDDNHDNLVTIKALLSEIYPDARLLMATSGVKGIEIAASEKPDVILLDVIMPGMDGFEVCRTLKADAALCDIPVVFVTAIKDDKESRILALESGAEAFLSKPIDESELTAQLRAMLKINAANLEKRNEKERLSALVEERTSELLKKNLLTINLLEDLRIENEARKKTESELRLSEEKFSKSFFTSPDSIIINRLDDGKIVEVNSGFTKMTGYDESEVIGKTTLELNLYINPGERNAIINELKTTGQAKDIECWFANKNGIPLLGLLSAVIIDINGVKHILSTTRDITERKRAEDALQKSETEFRLLAESMPQIVWITRPDGWNIFFNQQWVDYTGLSLEESYGNGWNKPFHPDDQQRAWDAWHNATTNLATYSLECRLRRFDGEYTWWLIRGIPVVDEQGAVVKWFGTCTDINEMKLAAKEFIKTKERAEESEEKYRMIFDRSLVAIVVADDKGDYLSANKAASDLLGYTVDELLKMNVGDLRTTVKPDAHKRYLEYLAKGEEKGEFDFIAKSGENRIAYYHAVRIRPDFNLSMIMNITERKQAESQLREKEIQYQNLANSGLSLIWTSGTDKLCNYFNEPWLKFTGRTLAQELGNGWVVGIHPDDFDLSVSTYTAAFEKKVPFEMEYRLLHVSGEYRWILDLGTPNYNSTGEFIGYIGNCFDINNRKLMEEELIKAKEHAEESDRLKSSFLANMSHEIRTPMNGILGFAELLKMPGLTGEQQHEYIAIIKRSGDRMLNIINNIVDISKIESGQMTLNLTETNINESLDFVYSFFEPEAKAKGLSLLISHRLPAEQAVIATDREKIYAILTNLIKNAIKFSDAGSIHIGLHLKGKFLEFFITDKGIGIPHDRQQAIFERFIQADISDKRAFQGAGLGLSISKAYAEMLGGKMWVESLEGEGSTFYFSIPYKTKKERNAGVWYVDPAELKLKEDLKLKVLVVEDDEISQRLVTLAVGKISKEIISVNSGIDAVEVCRKTPDIDLILMDIKMPEMDGYEATQQIRQFNKDTVIIAQTAFGLSGDKEKAIAAGCNGYISKPLSIDMLTKLIQTHFNLF